MSKEEPETAEYPDIGKMMDAIKSAEKALAEGHKNCVGNDLTGDVDGVDPDSIFYEALVKCRAIIEAAKIAGAS